MRKLLALALASSGIALAPGAAAAEPWVDQPLTLPPLHFSADAGIGFAQAETFGVDPTNPTGPLISEGNKVGWGSNLEAHVGLPFIGELGMRVGYRFDDAGIQGGADHFARLFDPIVNEPGGDSFTNPEIDLRGTLLPLDVFELGLETRVIVPTANGSDFALTPGVPMRVHLPGFLRVDTGVWLPLLFNGNPAYALDIPAQAYFQVDDAFFGPFTGIRFNHPGGGIDSTTDVPLGVGGGYTLGGIVDLKVQVRTERINDPNWAKLIGGGAGVGLRLP